MKQYYVVYYTLDGHKMAMTISAMNETDANILAHGLPNFRELAECIREVE